MVRLVSKTLKYHSDNTISGTFKLSDKTTTKFEIDRNGNWHQWGNSTDNLCVTVPEIEWLVKKINP